MQPIGKTWKEMSIGHRLMVSSVVILHVWMTALILAVLNGKESSIISDMFATMSYSVLFNLAILGGYQSLTKYLNRMPISTSSEESYTKTTKTGDPAVDDASYRPSEGER